jgi:hypothetical protein
MTEENATTTNTPGATTGSRGDDTSANRTGGNEPQQGATPDDAAVLEQAQNPDAVKNALTREREARAQAEAAAQKAQRQLAEVQEQGKTAEERARDAAEAKAAAERTGAENLRLRVALDKNVPADLVDRLRGETQAELEADAEQLMARIQPPQQQPPPAPDLGGGARNSAPAQGDMDARIRQAAGRG